MDEFQWFSVTSQIKPLNPLSPNSDQRQFSSNNIHMLPREMVMGVNEMITKDTLICLQTLSTNSLRKCMKISMENLYVDFGA